MSVSTSISRAPARSRQATRQRLLNSATILFAERGLHGATTHGIAREAGVASGTFYLHFRDKAEIYREILFDALALLRERVQEAVEDAPDEAAAVRARTEALVDFAAEHRAVVRIMFCRDSEAADIESDVLGDIAATLFTRLVAKQKEALVGEDFDPAVGAQAVLGMLVRVIDWWTEDPSRSDRKGIVDTLVRLQLHGTLPRRS